jgi:hypothetical protein
MKRPIGVTILMILAALSGLIALFHCMQFLFPNFLFLNTEILFYKELLLFTAIVWGVIVWMYAWVTEMLWKIETNAWAFLVGITLFNLGLDFILLLQAPAIWITWTFGMFLNVLVLLLVVLPGIRKPFGISSR